MAIETTDVLASKALSLVLNQIERSLVRQSCQGATRMKETISSGALTLDLALGGGYPRGE